MSGAAKGVAAWHAYIGNETAEALGAMLTDDAVFHSPVVLTPQVGKAIVSKYLPSAAKVLNNEGFAYVRDLFDGDNALLEFVSEIDGIKINGIDLIHFDAEGRIVDFKVMVRPLKAVNKLWELMAAQLQAAG